MDYITGTFSGDNYCFNLNPILFTTICANRRQRLQNAINAHMSTSFSSQPKQTLQTLNNLLEKYNEAYKTDNENIWLEKKNKVQENIDTGNYLINEFGPDWDYRQEYINHMKNFVWPNQEELSIREIEKNQLLGL